MAIVVDTCSLVMIAKNYLPLDKDGQLYSFLEAVSYTHLDVYKRQYLNTLLSNGFIINHIVEPQPSENMMDIPGMQDEMRHPMMLIVSVNKKMDR